MVKLKGKKNILNIYFYLVLFFKALTSLMELVGGFLILIINHESINKIIRSVAIPELRKDPTDVLMINLVKFGNNFSINSQYSVAIFMMLQGVAKLIVIWLLVKKKVWAYPLAVLVFLAFITYEIYSFINSNSIIVLGATVIDVAIIVVIILEYRLMIKEKKLNSES